jgi:hypothetical protein
VGEIPFAPFECAPARSGSSATSGSRPAFLLLRINDAISRRRSRLRCKRRRATTPVPEPRGMVEGKGFEDVLGKSILQRGSSQRLFMRVAPVYFSDSRRHESWETSANTTPKICRGRLGAALPLRSASAVQKRVASCDYYPRVLHAVERQTDGGISRGNKPGGPGDLRAACRR